MFEQTNTKIWWAIWLIDIVLILIFVLVFLVKFQQYSGVGNVNLPQQIVETTVDTSQAEIVNNVALAQVRIKDDLTGVVKLIEYDTEFSPLQEVEDIEDCDVIVTREIFAEQQLLQFTCE